jgi:hypothetical protein
MKLLLFSLLAGAAVAHTPPTNCDLLTAKYGTFERARALMRVYSMPWRRQIIALASRAEGPQDLEVIGQQMQPPQSAIGIRRNYSILLEELGHLNTLLANKDRAWPVQKELLSEVEFGMYRVVSSDEPVPDCEELGLLNPVKRGEAFYNVQRIMEMMIIWNTLDETHRIALGDPNILRGRFAPESHQDILLLHGVLAPVAPEQRAQNAKRFRAMSEGARRQAVIRFTIAARAIEQLIPVQ